MICQTSSEPRPNVVLIDFENVQPDTPIQFAHDNFRVLVFVGAGQTKLPFDVAASLQKLGARAEYIRISGNGPNALDFHIAYYIGALAAENPSIYFHIVSKDTGFDPLIAHLRAKKILVARVSSVLEIPLANAAGATSAAERLTLALAKLQRMKNNPPASIKTLSSTLTALFNSQLKLSLTAEEIDGVVQSMVSARHIAIDGTQVTYNLPGGNG